MINTQGKLLITAFVAILIGVVLIQSIADDVELVKTSSYTALNESLLLTVNTITISNESATMVAENTTTLANTFLFNLTALRNESSQDYISYCNVTLSTGVLVCNDTGGAVIYADYIYYSDSTGTLAFNDLISYDANRNSSMISKIGDCNITLSTGGLVCNKTAFGDNTTYSDYTYEPDTPYLRSSTPGTLLTITIIFFVIGILTVGIGYAVKSFKEGGIM